MSKKASTATRNCSLSKKESEKEKITIIETNQENLYYKKKRKQRKGIKIVNNQYLI